MGVNKININVNSSLNFNENNSVVSIDSERKYINLIIINGNNNTINVNIHNVEKIIINGNNNKIYIADSDKLIVIGINNYIYAVTSKVNVVGNNNYLNVTGFDLFDNLITITGKSNIIKSHKITVLLVSSRNLVEAIKSNIIDFNQYNYYKVDVDYRVVLMNLDFTVKYEHIETTTHKNCIFISMFKKIIEDDIMQQQFDDMLAKLENESGAEVESEK